MATATATVDEATDTDWGVVYRSVHPAAMKVWTNAEADRQRWLRRSRDLRRKHLGGAELVSVSTHTSHKVVGYVLKAGKRPLPGWRVLKKAVLESGEVYADPIPESARGGRTDEAKEARALLEKLQPPKPVFTQLGERFAVPQLVFASARGGGVALHWPSIRSVIDPGRKTPRLYIYWDVLPTAIQWTGESADGIRYFEPVPMSEYYKLAGK